MRRTRRLLHELLLCFDLKLDHSLSWSVPDLGHSMNYAPQNGALGGLQGSEMQPGPVSEPGPLSVNRMHLDPIHPHHCFIPLSSGQQDAGPVQSVFMRAVARRVVLVLVLVPHGAQRWQQVHGLVIWDRQFGPRSVLVHSCYPKGLLLDVGQGALVENPARFQLLFPDLMHRK